MHPESREKDKVKVLLCLRRSWAHDEELQKQKSAAGEKKVHASARGSVTATCTPPNSVFHTRIQRCEILNQSGGAPRTESGVKPPRMNAPGIKGER